MPEYSFESCQCCLKFRTACHRKRPFVWWRYIDDIFMIWTEGEDNLKTFINYLNSIHPTIKFTHEYSNSSNQSLPFLDVQVHLNNNQIQTDLHTKPTDKHQYLLKSSCHPAHTKRNIPFSLALRLRPGGGGGYLGQFMLGMCRWPLRTPTPL